MSGKAGRDVLLLNLRLHSFANVTAELYPDRMQRSIFLSDFGQTC